MLYSISVVLVVGRLSLTLDSLLRAPAATVLLLNSTARHQCWWCAGCRLIESTALCAPPKPFTDCGNTCLSTRINQI